MFENAKVGDTVHCIDGTTDRIEYLSDKSFVEFYIHLESGKTINESGMLLGSKWKLLMPLYYPYPVKIVRKKMKKVDYKFWVNLYNDGSKSCLYLNEEIARSWCTKEGKTREVNLSEEWEVEDE